MHAVAAEQGQDIVEIGPGLGALTEGLANSGANLSLIEIDRDLAARMRGRYGHRAQVREGDVLKLRYADLCPLPIRLVGNLPYNISTPLLFHGMAQLSQIVDMHFMLQEEVAARLVAKPGNRTYGRLSVMVQYHCDVEKLFRVPPSAFLPEPRVNSVLVRLKPRQTGWSRHDPRQLARLVKSAFSQRRKTLRRVLKGVVTEEQFAAAGLNAAARPESLAPADYVRLAQSMRPEHSECAGEDQT